MTEPEQSAPNAQHDGAQPYDAQSDDAQNDDTGHNAASEIRRRRLLFRATHRGTYENDLMIGGFVRAHLTILTEADVDALEVVMEMPDTDLAEWLTGREAIPTEKETPMLRRMRDFLAR